MNELLVWIFFTLLLSAALLLFFVWRAPYFITKAVIRGFGRKIEGEPWNQFKLSGLATSGSDSVVMTNPDMIYLFGVYEVSKQPVVIHCVAPEEDLYWCVSLYALNTDNFYFKNDRACRDREFDLVIAGPRSEYQRTGNEEVVVAPTPVGVILIRTVVRDPQNANETAHLQELLSRTTMTPYQSWRSRHAAVTAQSQIADSEVRPLH